MTTPSGSIDPYLASMTPDWDRSIFIQSEIGEDLLKAITPQILKLRSKGSKKITIGVDSYGGSIQILESIDSLVRTKDAQGNEGTYLCVATNNAFSAAAVLLTWADYSIAYKHATILFHDTRFSQMTNVTPTKALQTARDLKSENDRLALILAKNVTQRLVWVYLDKSLNFPIVRAKYTQVVSKYEPAMEHICPKNPDNEIDVLGLALTILDNLESKSTQQLVYRALNRLIEWISIERIERAIADHEKSSKGSSLAGAINSIFDAIKSEPSEKSDEDSSQSAKINDRLQYDLKLFLEIVLKSANSDPEWTISAAGFDKIQKDFDLVGELRSNSHARDIIRMMLESDHTFLGHEVANKLEKTTNIEERRKILAPFYPQARLFWYFSVLLCKTMFEGENLISANDAQLLGVVDEVAGGGPVESRREFHVRSAGEKAAKASS